MQERFVLFTGLIASINRSIKKIKSMEMGEFDLKGPHVSCLYYLYNGEELTAKELCDIAQEDKASISRSIDYLEKNGYIYCGSNAKKRYKSALMLTNKGKEVGEKISIIIDKMLDKASDGLTDESRIVLYKSLDIISTNLQNVCDKYLK